MADAASPASAAVSSSLLRSSALTLATSALPLLVAVFALPILSRQLGTERLGLLALAWAWLAYAMMLDLGLGRAVTQLVSSADVGDPGPDRTVAASVVTASALLTGIGILVAVLGVLAGPWYVTRVLAVSAPLQADAIIASVVFALAVPAITGASVPRAVLEARQRFRTVNLVRLPVGIGTFAVPVLLLPFTSALAPIAVTLAAIRYWAWWRYHVLAIAELPQLSTERAARARVPGLLRAGAWMTVSNVVSPLMTVADRFLIGSLVSVSAVALYAVPWEAITKLWIVPGSLTMILFPAAARMAAAGSPDIAPLYSVSVRLITLVVVPLCAVVALFAAPLLQLVTGGSYPDASATVLRILAVGVAANCIAAVPFTVLQATGHARWAALANLAEVLPFLGLLWLLVRAYGITGAAVAWSARTIIDAAVLLWRANVVAAMPSGVVARTGGCIALVAGAAWIGHHGGLSLPIAIGVAGVLTIVVPAMLWQLRSQDERRVVGSLRRVP